MSGSILHRQSACETESVSESGHCLLLAVLFLKISGHFSPTNADWSLSSS
jgi:hypothetical protein